MRLHLGKVNYEMGLEDSLPRWFTHMADKLALAFGWALS